MKKLTVLCSIALVGILLMMILGCQTADENTPAASTTGGSAELPALSQQSNELPLRIVSLTSPINPGLNATLVVETIAGAECSAVVDYGPSGNTVLYSKTVDSNGKISWTWLVGKFPGTWQITVTANYGGKSKSIMTPFTVR